MPLHHLVIILFYDELPRFLKLILFGVEVVDRRETFGVARKTTLVFGISARRFVRCSPSL